MFGLMSVKKHKAVVDYYGYVLNVRDETIDVRNRTIERLQRENARLLSEVSGPQEQKDEGATYVLKSLADALHVEDWSIQSGSEEWEGDVWATMFRILIDAGVVEEDHHTVATHAEIAALRPDAEKYRERCRRDREHAENARERKRAAREGVA
ncbi:hypothetical protein [Sphingobium yanoikuyae]|uniref:hypothetical protein n=1 Tax=Sphingobium yanoikuyae TaxID=13690 RepID=UPI00345E0A12